MRTFRIIESRVIFDTILPVEYKHQVETVELKFLVEPQSKLKDMSICVTDRTVNMMLFSGAKQGMDSEIDLSSLLWRTCCHMFP